MKNLTLALGAVLVLLGVGFYFGTGRESVTALIPAFFGIVLLLLGLWAANEAKRALAMHIAAAVALLGFLGTIPGFLKGFRYLGGTALERPEAVLAQVIMGVLCLVYVGFGVRSFVRARAARSPEA